MNRLLLLKTQQNQVFEILCKVGLDPREFEWGEARMSEIAHLRRPEAAVSQLDHVATGFFFRFDPRDHYNVLYRPGPQSPEDSIYTISWSDVLTAVHGWAVALKRELDAPDLWSGIASAGDLFKGGDSLSDETPFTEEEQERVGVALGRIEAYVLEMIGVQDEHKRFVAREFQYLRKAAERAGRVDWKNIFVGTMIAMMMSTVIPPTKMKALFSFAAEALGKLIESVPLLP